MDGREDQIVLVEQRHAGLVAGRIRRIERQFGQEAFAGGIAAGDLFELDQIGAAGLGILVNAVEMRFVPEPRALEIGRPFRISRRSPIGLRRKLVQSSPARGGDGSWQSAAIGSAASAMWSSTRCAEAGPTPGHQMHQPEAGDAVARVLDKPQQRQHVLDVRGIEELQPAEFDERNVAPGEFDFERSAVAARSRNSTACCFSSVPASRFSSTRSTM